MYVRRFFLGSSLAIYNSLIVEHLCCIIFWIREGSSVYRILSMFSVDVNRPDSNR